MADVKFWTTIALKGGVTLACVLISASFFLLGWYFESFGLGSLGALFLLFGGFINVLWSKNFRRGVWAVAKRR